MIKLEASTTDQFDLGHYRGNWGDQENGTYNNPILAGDYSDPDIIRVGENYFLITSTMQLSPGLTVLWSTDLVNWTIINHAVKDLTQISNRYNWDQMDGYARGIWAPCISYNKSNNTFFIHFGTPDEGFFMVKTQDPFGEWSDVYEIQKHDGSGFGFGWDDCTVLWDDNGQGYFVGTHFDDNYKTFLFKIADDGMTLQDTGVLIHASNDEYNPMEYNPEANKLFKKDGNYYFLHNGCYKVDGRYVRMAWIMKSNHLYGVHADGSNGDFNNPGKYEHIPLPIVEGYREPCQGNIIDAIMLDGERKWYFFTHHGQTDIDGRPCSLLPLVWENDWPIVASSDSQNKMIWGNLEKPFPNTDKIVPQTSDDFNDTQLGHQWMWNFQSRKEMWTLEERPGYLRLHAFNPLIKNHIDTAGNTLLQRCYRYKRNEAHIKLDISGMQEGQVAGVLHASGRLYVGLGIAIENQKILLKLVTDETTRFIDEIPAATSTIWIRSEWDFNFNHIYSYSFDGINYFNTNHTIQLKAKDYRGDYIGFFNYNNISENGYLDIDYIKLTHEIN